MPRFLPLAALIALLPAAALAHDPAAAPSGFDYGLLHPLTGPDHLLAMLAVGLWAAASGRPALAAYPSVFLGAMLTGAAVGAAGAVPFVAEPMILASVIALGALVAFAVAAPPAAGGALVLLFGLAHGLAHGAEGPAGQMAAFAAGFTLSTAALIAAGACIGRLADRLPLAALPRLLGGATAFAGVALAMA
jgi:urease accessory protein